MSPSLSTTMLLRTQSDARLAHLSVEGHARAFEAIVERYRKPLHRYLRRMLPHGRVEDVLQQTFLGAWAGLREGTEVQDVRAWLYRIAHNAAVNALKRSGYDYDELRDSLRGADGPDGDVERRTVMRETLASVASLPDRQRRALLETAVEGRASADVAREMGLSEGAFRQLVHRARMSVRAAATALTPLPLATWAAGVGSAAGGGEAAGTLATRLSELAAGAGGAGVSATALKAGAIVAAAGALAAGPAGLSPIRGGPGSPAEGPSTALAEAPRGTTARTVGASAGGLRVSVPGDDRRGARSGSNRGPDRGERERDRSGSSGPGSGSNDSGDDRGGDSDGRGPGRSGDDDRSRSESSGPGSSDSGSSGSDDRSGSGPSGSDSSGSGSGSSSSGSGEGSGSGSSGSGSAERVGLQSLRAALAPVQRAGDGD